MEPGGTNVPFRAVGVATIRFNSVKTTGTIGIGSTVITGIGTTNIIVGDRVRLESGFDAVTILFQVAHLLPDWEQTVLSFQMRQQMLV